MVWPIEPYARSIGTPGVPWAVRTVFVALSGGARLSYELGRPLSPDDLLTRRDGRRRLALEAFTALPMARMGADLQRYLDSLKGTGVREAAQAPMLAALDELVAFVKRFGPLGIGWGMTLPVENSQADSWERELRGPAIAVSGPQTQHYWVASFYGQGAGRWGPGQVRRERAMRPDADPAVKRELDDTVPSDLVWRIQDEQKDLRQALDFAEVIARDNVEQIRSFIRATGWYRAISLRGIDPRGTDWRRVRRGGPSLGRREWDPFARGEDTDWRLFARLLLSNLIGRQLNFVLPYVDADEQGRLRLDLRPASVLEVIYLQLLDQVRYHPEFGVGWCRYCRGAILRTRRADSATANVWHAGRCGSAGHARVFRAKEQP